MKTTKSSILNILLILFVVVFVGYSFYVLANLSMIDYQNREPTSEISSEGLILEGEGIEISDRFYIPKREWKLTYEVLGRKSESFQQVGIVISVYSIDHNEIVETRALSTHDHVIIYFLIACTIIVWFRSHVVNGSYSFLFKEYFVCFPYALLQVDFYTKL